MAEFMGEHLGEMSIESYICKTGGGGDQMKIIDKMNLKRKK